MAIKPGRPRRISTPEGHWKCTGCKRYKSSDEFYKNNGTPSGLSFRCKDCMNKYQAARRNDIKTSQFREELGMTFEDAKPQDLEPLVELYRAVLEAKSPSQRDIYRAELARAEFELGQVLQTRREIEDMPDELGLRAMFRTPAESGQTSGTVPDEQGDPTGPEALFGTESWGPPQA